ncbi:MAG: hypothetical protein ABI200_07450 [Gaiellales bacterium]
MGRIILNWWESRSGRDRVLIGIPIATVVLFVFHQAFPLLSQQQRLLYALMEAVPLSLVWAWATQNELRRRAEAKAAADKRAHDDGAA